VVYVVGYDVLHVLVHVMEELDEQSGWHVWQEADEKVRDLVKLYFSYNVNVQKMSLTAGY
jgi:hypothetical protein